MPRIAIVSVRVSSHRQKVEKSLAEQELEIRAAVDRVGARVLRVEMDEAKTGTKLVGRDGLERAIKAIENGEANELWVWRLDRLARDEGDYHSVIWRRVVEKAGARICDAAGFDSDEPSARLTGSIMVAVAAEESRKIGERTRRGIEGRWREGCVHGLVPYGYRLVADARDAHGFKVRRAEIDPERAVVVQRVFVWCAQGVGIKDTARRLNAEKLPSPTSTSAGWCASTVYKMLTATPIYLGLLGVHHHPGLQIVTNDLAQRAREAMSARGRAAGVRRADGALEHGASGSGRAAHLLSGWLRCPSCGGSMRSYSSASRLRYRCGSNIDARGCANGMSVLVDVADRRIIETVRDQVLSSDALAYARAKLEQSAKSAVRDSRGAHTRLLRERTSIEVQLSRLTEAIASGRGAPRSLVEKIETLEERLVKVGAELARPVEAQRAATALHPATVKKLVTEALPLLVKDPKRARPLLHALLGTPRLEAVEPAGHRPYYRATFEAHPAAILLTGTDRVTEGACSNPIVQVTVDLR